MTSPAYFPRVSFVSALIPCHSHDPRTIVLFSISAFLLVFTVGACNIKNVHAYELPARLCTVHVQTC